MSESDQAIVDRLARERLATATTRRMPQWQPIETAPKDRDILLLESGRTPHEGKWLTRAGLQYTWKNYIPPDGWYWAGYAEKPVGPINATHWMPLPEPPTT